MWAVVSIDVADPVVAFCVEPLFCGVLVPLLLPLPLPLPPPPPPHPASVRARTAAPMAAYPVTCLMAIMAIPRSFGPLSFGPLVPGVPDDPIAATRKYGFEPFSTRMAAVFEGLDRRRAM
jgi:hypothetical protein